MHYEAIFTVILVQAHGLELTQELPDVTDTHRIHSTWSTPWPRRAVQQVGQS